MRRVSLPMPCPVDGHAGGRPSDAKGKPTHAVSCRGTRGRWLVQRASWGCARLAWRPRPCDDRSVAAYPRRMELPDAANLADYFLFDRLAEGLGEQDRGPLRRPQRTPTTSSRDRTRALRLAARASAASGAASACSSSCPTRRPSRGRSSAPSRAAPSSRWATPTRRRSDLEYLVEYTRATAVVTIPRVAERARRRSTERGASSGPRLGRPRDGHRRRPGGPERSRRARRTRSSRASQRDLADGLARRAGRHPPATSRPSGSSRAGRPASRRPTSTRTATSPSTPRSTPRARSATREAT